jgi:ABC-type branched-subunit amino acid transport system substrate-binding protein
VLFRSGATACTASASASQARVASSPEIEPAARQIAQASPEIVIIGLAATASNFVLALRKLGCHSLCWGISLTATPIRAMGRDADGVGFAIVMPSPFTRKSELVRRYQDDMAASGNTDFSLQGLEGYVCAATLTEALRHAGPAPTRAAVVAALDRIKNFDLGGLKIDFGNPTHEGNSFVETAIYGTNGRLLS